MKKLLFIISRVIVGVVFLLSGFAKAVDPTGYAIKITDYLVAFNVEAFSSIAYVLAVGISALEFITGAHLIIGLRNKLFSIIVTIFMAIFTPLTLWIALFNPVTDCGCFGDAYQLSNWETFLKNIVLLVPTLYVFFNRKNYPSRLNAFQSILTTLGLSSLIVYISIAALNHLPILDFRPYHIGANIQEGMTIPDGAEQPEYLTTFTLEKDGVQKEFSAENYPYTDTTWVFVDSKTKVIKEGYQPPIHDFVLIDEEGNDFTSTLLNSSTPTLLVVSPQIKKGNWENSFNKITALKNLGLEKNINTYVLTASSNADISEFEFANNAGYQYLTADETVLKTMIRSNPGVILIQDGTIISKWHYNNIPSANEFSKPISYSLKEQKKQANSYWLWCLVLGTVLFISIIYLSKRK
ncbi:BT_3928 family protein [Saccharicrinis aurantiacus]|uniref:BT_3928 family protein n=1 Tax=Saccharicrinis aurantiacus TaxID=1849719 RepID=UPI00094F85DF|nr:BT_3928 family protein [Saccharicrinis aurantiacus]